MVKRKKIPLRVCLGCQEKKPKQELVRVVRTPAGEVLLDPTGKKAGRGAYICPCEECLRKAVKGRRLEKNLQQHIPEELIASIALTLKSIAKED